MTRVLSDEDVATVLDIGDLLPVVADAFAAQYRGDVERPPRPHFPVGFDPAGDEVDQGDATAGAAAAAGMGLTMPAYIHGRDVYATKLAAVHEANPDRGLPTVNAQIAVTGAYDGQLEALLHGTRITNARTGCIGGLAVRELAPGPVTLALVGAGTQARWQARAIHAATDVDAIRVYSPSDSKEACASDLQDELGVTADAVPTARDAVLGADVVVTATTSTDPVFPPDALDPNALVVAVGAYNAEMQELPPEVVEQATHVYADVPEEVADVGDLRASHLDAADLLPFGSLFVDLERPDTEGLLVVESVGSAVLDAATAEHVLARAVDADVGTDVAL